VPDRALLTLFTGASSSQSPFVARAVVRVQRGLKPGECRVLVDPVGHGAIHADVLPWRARVLRRLRQRRSGHPCG